MAYRDDAEALFTRATVLEQELELARRQLAERDRELAALRRGVLTPSSARTGADTDDILDRLLRDEEREAQAPPRVMPLRAGRSKSPAPRLDRAKVLDRARDAQARVVPPLRAGRSKSPAPRSNRAKVLERARDALGALDDEPLLMIGAVIETLGDEHDIRFATLERIVELVRWINEIRG